MKIIDGAPHVSTFLFIKTHGNIGFEQALNHFDINTYVLDQSFDGLTNRLWLHDDNTWLHILDGWDYYLFHLTDLEMSLESLSEEYDLLWFCIGECDLSFEIQFWQEGRVTRSIAVHSRNYSDQNLVKNEGCWTNVEKEILSKTGEIQLKDPDKFVHCLLDYAKSFGIKAGYTEENLTVINHEYVSS